MTKACNMCDVFIECYTKEFPEHADIEEAVNKFYHENHTIESHHGFVFAVYDYYEQLAKFWEYRAKDCGKFVDSKYIYFFL